MKFLLTAFSDSSLEIAFGNSVGEFALKHRSPYFLFNIYSTRLLISFWLFFFALEL